MAIPLPQSKRKRSLPPYFTPANLRTRRDGWTPERQCRFLAALYTTGSVASAARVVGKSRASAYKLRGHDSAQSFAETWDRVIAGPGEPGVPVERGRRVKDWRKLTLEELHWRLEIGLWRPVIYRGKMRAIARKPDNSALLRLIRRLDNQVAGIEEEAL